MTTKIKFKNGRVEDYTIVLSTRDYRHLGQLHGLKGTTYSGNMNSANEMSFTVYKSDLVKGNDKIYNKKIEKHREYLWENIVDFKLIWIKELDEYFEIKVSIDDSNDIYKTITATSLCEAELSQTNLYNIEINTENDIAREDYEVTTFYNVENPNASLLNRILECAPHYKIKHVDKSLCKIQRTFSIDGTSVYDFLVGECSEQFNCLFVFNSAKRSISVYDLLTVCNKCEERGEFYDKCPNCGSKDLKYYGKDTTIYVDKNNLTDAIHFETNTDSVKNCFKLEAGDPLMTSTVRALNHNGSDRIYVNTEDQLKDMPEELVEKIKSYDELYDSYTEEYEDLLLQSYELTDDISYYKVNAQSNNTTTVETYLYSNFDLYNDSGKLLIEGSGVTEERGTEDNTNSDSGETGNETTGGDIETDTDSDDSGGILSGITQGFENVINFFTQLIENVGNILSFLNPFSENFILKGVLNFLGEIYIA